jgi:tetratricopeptide (TPR) repeat protein
LRALTGFAVDRTGERVAVANPDGLIYLYDEFGEPRSTLQGYAAGVYSLAFDPQGSGNLLAAGYEDGRVKLWDLANQREIAATTTTSLRCAAVVFAPTQGWALAGCESGVIQRWESPSCAEIFRLTPQRYEFTVTRAREGSGIRLEARRNGILLRAEAQEAGSGPLVLTVRRKDEYLGVQAGKNAEVVFYDYFPPTPMEGGTWGVSLSPSAALARLTANRRLPSPTASPFEQGYSLFRRNRIAEALAFFDQQAKFAAGENAVEVRQEAELRSAICLVRLNRLDDAKKILKLLAAEPGGGKQAALVALFQLWTIYLKQADHAEAGKVFAQVRLKEAGEEFRGFIAADTQQQIVNHYLDFVSRRKSFIEPGMAPRMEAALAVCEFFDIDSEQTLDLRWRYFETQRLLGVSDDPLGLGSLSNRFEKGLQLPANPAGFTEKELVRLAHYSLLCRCLGRPARAEALLDSLLWDSAKQLLPDVQGPSLALLLERARLSAHRQQWDEVLRYLDQLFQRGSQTVSPRRVFVAAHLLRGFALQRRGLAKEAADAWKNGCAQLNLSAADLNQAPLSEDGVTEFLGVLVLGALGDHFDDAALEQARVKLQTWAGTLSGGSDLMPSLTPPPAGMRRMWRGAKGQEIAEQLACGALTNGEQAAGMFKLLAAEMVRDGGFGGKSSPEQDEIIWQVCDGGMRAYFQDLVRMQGMLQIGLAWKAPDFVFGWPSTINVVPQSMQAELAYVLAHRCRLRGRTADAQTLLNLARERSAEASLVHRLVLAEITP